MKTPSVAVLILLLSACGVETATTAATSAQIKKQEVQQAQQTMDAAKQKIEASTQQVQQRAEQSGGEK